MSSHPLASDMGETRLSTTKLNRALYWQRRALTFTEIANRLGVERQVVVLALYWDVMLAKHKVKYEASKRRYAGAPR